MLGIYSLFSLRNRSFSLVGQNDDIKDCINQRLSERDSSPRLAEGEYRRVATPWFEEEERMTERKGSTTGADKLRERHEFWLWFAKADLPMTSRNDAKK